MPYVIGQKITPTDYNTFVGSNGSGSAYPSSAAATGIIGGIYGIGYGDRGYGQTGVTLSTLTSSSRINAQAWTNLRTALATCLNHQSGSLPATLPPASKLSVGQRIEAHESSAPTSDSYDINSLISQIDTNRFNTNSGSSMTLTGNAHTITRSGAWNSTITGEVNVTFSSTNHARYFFNSGGQLRLLGAQPGGTSQDSNWNNVLKNIVGTVSLSANGTTRSGTGGTASGSIGYYQLTTSYQTIYNGTNIGTGAYASNDVLIQALVNNAPSNGGPGNVIRFRIRLTDQHSNSWFDSVASGTNFVFSHLRATVHLSGISAPTYSTYTGFA